MNSYLGMTMVKKEQGQDDYFRQQSRILLTLPTYISPLLTNYYVQNEIINKQLIVSCMQLQSQQKLQLHATYN